MTAWMGRVSHMMWARISGQIRRARQNKPGQYEGQAEPADRARQQPHLQTGPHHGGRDDGGHGTGPLADWFGRFALDRYPSPG